MYLLLSFSAGFALSVDCSLWLFLFLPAPLLYLLVFLRMKYAFTGITLFSESCIILCFLFYILPMAEGSAAYTAVSLLWLIPYSVLHRKTEDHGFFLIMLSLFLSAFLPLSLFRILNGQGPVSLLVIFQIFVNGLLFSASMNKLRNQMFIISAVLLAFFIFTVFTGILITPVSAYFAWFEIMAEKGVGGVISFIFVLLLALFMYIPSCLLYFSSFYSAITALLLILLFFTALAFQNNFLVVILAVSLSLGLFISAQRRSVIPGSYQSPLVIIVLAFLPAVIFTSVKSKPYDDFIDTVVFPGLRSLVIRINDDFPLLYALPGYGYSIDGSVLGGRPVLSERPVFKVKLPDDLSEKTSLYLRTQVLYDYTGRGWQTGQQDNSSKLSTFTPVAAENVLSPLEVEILVDFYSLIPHFLNFPLPSVHSDTYEILPLDGGYQMKRAMYLSHSVSLFKSDEMITRPADTSFLYISDSTRDSLGEIEQKLSAEGGLKGRDFLDELERYLSYNYQYSLDTDVNPEGTDAVSYFLTESRKGYCSHFASAYVLLCRLNGIPARYVSGFLVSNPEKENTIIVRGFSAHAWAEVYLPEGGWQIREATPPMNSVWGEHYLRTRYSEYITDDYTREQLDQLQLPGVYVPSHGAAEKKNLLTGFSPVYFIIPVILILTAVMVFFILRIRSPLTRLKIYIGLITFRYHLPDPSAGWPEWMKQLEFKRPSSPVSAFHRDIIEVAYGGRPVNRKILSKARSFLFF